jgi:hypothetical protein
MRAALMARRVLPLLLDEGLAADVRAHAHVWRAQLRSRGRWHAADRHWLPRSIWTPPPPRRERYWPRCRSRRMRPRALPRSKPPFFIWIPPPCGDDVSWRAVYNGLHPILRTTCSDCSSYGAAIARASGGAPRAGARAAQGGGRDGRELARGLAESLLGHVAIANARGSEALARFDTARLRVSEGLLESQVGSQAYERWARAELLFRMGRLQEALPWYATLAETSIDGLIYLAPAEARQAEICERLGDPDAAIAHYRRFLELWHDADPELGSWIAHARSRLQALGWRR